MEACVTKELTSKDYAALRGMLRDVEDLIDGEKWLLDRRAAAKWLRTPWAGAGTVICEELPNEVRSSDTYVVSPYVVELSWLIEKLKSICSGFVDYLNKEAFYGRLADSANRYLSQRPEVYRNPKDLCFAVVREASRLVEESECGEMPSVRNEVRIKQIWVQLHPGAANPGAGLAIYWVPASGQTSLDNEPFIFRGKNYRMGESTQPMPAGDQVMHMAVYYATEAKT